MTVVQAWLGGELVDFTKPAAAVDAATATSAAAAGGGQSPGAALSATLAAVPRALRSTLRDHLSMNSTAVLVVNDKGVREVKGSKTEGAGLLLVRAFGFDPLEIREAAQGEPVSGTPQTHTPVRQPKATPVRTRGSVPASRSAAAAAVAAVAAGSAPAAFAVGSPSLRPQAAPAAAFNTAGVRHGHSPRHLQHPSAQASRASIIKQVRLLASYA